MTNLYEMNSRSFLRYYCAASSSHLSLHLLIIDRLKHLIFRGFYYILRFVHQASRGYSKCWFFHLSTNPMVWLFYRNFWMREDSNEWSHSSHYENIFFLYPCLTVAMEITILVTKKERPVLIGQYWQLESSLESCENWNKNYLKQSLFSSISMEARLILDLYLATKLVVCLKLDSGFQTNYHSCL